MSFLKKESADAPKSSGDSMSADLLAKKEGAEDAPKKQTDSKKKNFLAEMWSSLPWWLKLIAFIAIFILITQLVCTSPADDGPMPWEQDSTSVEVPVPMPKSPASRGDDSPAVVITSPSPSPSIGNGKTYEMLYASINGGLVNETSVTIMVTGDKFTLFNERGEDIVVYSPPRTYDHTGNMTSITIGETTFYANEAAIESLRGGSKPPHQSGYKVQNEIGIHIVREDENAAKIAQMYGMELRELQRLNYDLCRGGDCSLLKIGDKIKVYLRN